MVRSQISGWSLPDAPAYGGHSIYLFSTLDDPTEECLRTPSPILSPNPKPEKTGDGSPLARPGDSIAGDSPSSDDHALTEHEDVQMDESGDQEESEEEGEEGEDDAETKYSDVPVILPRRSFKGMSNLRTIKDGTIFVFVGRDPVADNEISLQ